MAALSSPERLHFEVARAQSGGAVLVARGAQSGVSLHVNASVLVSVGGGKARWVLLRGCREGDAGEVVLGAADAGPASVSLRFEREGSVSAQCTGAGSRVLQVRLLLFGSSTELSRGFVQGWQTWSLNAALRTRGEGRKKSIMSKLGFSGMFMDTDSPLWTFRGKGQDSWGMVLLGAGELKDAAGGKAGSGAGVSSSPHVLLGGPSCRRGCTAFWTLVQGGETLVKCVIDFGSPGVEPGAGGAGARELLRFYAGGSTQQLLERFAEDCRELADDVESDPALRLRSPLRELGRAPVGWGSWYEFYERVTARDVSDVVAAISANEPVKRAVDVLQLDDGYQLNTGDWLDTVPRFGEQDLSVVARNIVAAGFTPGLWVAPFLASKTSNVFREHPDWFLRKPGSAPRGSSNGGKPQYVVGHINPAWNRGSYKSTVMHVLDLSHPEALAHLERVFRQLSKHWRLFKIDFLAAGLREGTRHAPGVTRVEAYIQGVRAIRRGMGPQGFLLGCGAPLMPSAQSGCFDSMRVSCDTAERWSPPWALRQVVGDWAIPCCSVALWGNMTRYYMHGALWKFSDPDCLVLRRKGNSMSDAEIRTQVSLLGLTGGLLLFTDNMKTLEEDRLAMALGVLPATPMRGRPAGDMLVPGPPALVELGDLADACTPAVAALVNWAEERAALVAPRDGFSFWSQRRVAKGERVRLEPHDTLALQCPAQGALLIGNTLHLTALADGRIKAEQLGRTCTVKGTDELVRRKGLLVFDAQAKRSRVLSSKGLRVTRPLHDLEGGAAAIEIEITDRAWTVTVEVGLA
jgi:hypothetical protein